MKSANLQDFGIVEMCVDCGDWKGQWRGAYRARNYAPYFRKFVVYKIEHAGRPEPIEDWPKRGFMLDEISRLSLQDVNDQIRSAPSLYPPVYPDGPWNTIWINKSLGKSVFGESEEGTEERKGGLLGYSLATTSQWGFTWLRMDMQRLCTRYGRLLHFEESNKPNCTWLPENPQAAISWRLKSDGIFNGPDIIRMHTSNHGLHQE